MMDEGNGTKARKANSDLDNVHLACPVDMAKGLEASFG